MYERASGLMIGLARAVSDGESLANIADVYVHPDHRGTELGVQLVQTMVDGGPGSHLSWMLHTRDAHGFYAKAGFRAPDETYLERPGGPRAPARPPVPDRCTRRALRSFSYDPPDRFYHDIKGFTPIVSARTSRVLSWEELGCMTKPSGSV